MNSCYPGGTPRGTHGMTKTPTYKSWMSMKERCLNQNNSAFARYGAHGITICERWLNSFEDFLADMGERPAGATLDRFPDQRGNYEPSNCRWATVVEQNRNKRTNRLLTHDGLTLPISVWAEKTGMSHNLIWGRIHRGWSHAAALTAPLNSEKTHCPQGHPYSGENLFVRRSGKRECRACMRESCKQQRIKRRVAERHRGKNNGSE